MGGFYIGVMSSRGRSVTKGATSSSYTITGIAGDVLQTVLQMLQQYKVVSHNMVDFAY